MISERKPQHLSIKGLKQGTKRYLELGVIKLRKHPQRRCALHRTLLDKEAQAKKLGRETI